jgi:hypothetical protein
MADFNDFLLTDGVDYPQAAHIMNLRATSLRSEFINTETITGTKQLTDNDLPYQVITASGADRDVELPAEGTSNHPIVIYNAGPTYNVVIKDDAGAITYATLPPDKMSTWIQVNGEGWKHLGALMSTTAPSAPISGDLWWETDTNLEWYYDGTRWLSSTLYSAYTGMNQSATAANILFQANNNPVYGYDIWIVNHYVQAHVITTNSATNYWKFELRKVTTSTVPANGAGTLLGSGVNSSAVAANTWFELSEAIGAAVDHTGSGLEVLFLDIYKNNAPGNAWVTQGYTYRLIHP